MNYGFFQYKTIHFDDLEPLLSPGIFESCLIPHFEISAKTEKDQLPVLIRWTFRISKNRKDVFSCIGETNFLLNFVKGENPSRDLDLLISTSFISLEMKWENETKTIPSSCQTIHSPNDTVKEAIKTGILKGARTQGLL